MRNFRVEQDMREKSLEMARKRLRDRGHTQPLVSQYERLEDYFKAEDAYRMAETREIAHCFKELRAASMKREELVSNTPLSWVQRAYG